MALRELEDAIGLYRGRGGLLGFAAGPLVPTRPPDVSSLVQELADLLRDPGRAEAIPLERVSAMLAMLAALEIALAARLISAEVDGTKGNLPEPDHLLTAQEAAAILNVTPRWLYRRASRLPFTRRLSRKALRFSEVGIRWWMAAKK